MKTKWIALIIVVFGLSGFFGFSMSNASGIQPGYFEKQEAPAYGVSDEKPLGSDLGKEFEEHFKDLYKEE